MASRSGSGAAGSVRRTPQATAASRRPVAADHAVAALGEARVDAEHRAVAIEHVFDARGEGRAGGGSSAEEEPDRDPDHDDAGGDERDEPLGHRSPGGPHEVDRFGFGRVDAARPGHRRGRGGRRAGW